MNTPGVRFADQGKFHPLKFLYALAQEIHGNGVHIFENSAVTKFDSKKKRAKANGHWINYDRSFWLRTIHCWENPVLSAECFSQTKLSLYSSYVVGATIPRASIPIASFGTRTILISIFGSIATVNRTTRSSAVRIIRPARRLIPRPVSEGLSKRLLKLAPQAKTQHRWSGQVIEALTACLHRAEQGRPIHRDRLLRERLHVGVTAAVMARDGLRE